MNSPRDSVLVSLELSKDHSQALNIKVLQSDDITYIEYLSCMFGLIQKVLEDEFEVKTKEQAQFLCKKFIVDFFE